MKQIITSIAIDVPAKKVWDNLVDFGRYPDWNPFIRRIDGKLEKGSTLDVEMSLPGSRPMRLRPKVTGFREGKELRWEGKLLIKGLLDAEHFFLVKRSKTSADKTRFIQGEYFSGIMVPFLSGTIEKTRSQFIEMNIGLKRASESGKRNRIRR